MSIEDNGITSRDKISLKEYFDDKFLASDKALVLAFESLKIRLESIDKATEVAKIAMEKRLDALNELRQMVNETLGRCITKDNYDTKQGAMQAQIDDLRLSRAELQGKASLNSVYIAYGLSFLSIIVALIKLFR